MSWGVVIGINKNNSPLILKGTVQMFIGNNFSVLTITCMHVILLSYMVVVQFSLSLLFTLLITGSVVFLCFCYLKVNIRSFIVNVFLSILIGLFGYSPHHSGLDSLTISILTCCTIACLFFLYDYFILKICSFHLWDYAKKLLMTIFIGIVVGGILVCTFSTTAGQVDSLQDVFFDSVKLFLLAIAISAIIGNALALCSETRMS